MKKIVTMILVMSIGLWADFSKSGDIVTDHTTKLQWQDDAVGSSMEWQEAIDYCENTLTLGGHSDWRLPNKKELLSIVDYSKNNPSIDSQFQNTTSDGCWSSTTYASYTYHAWVVYFSCNFGASRRSSFKVDDKYVRCVRTGQ